MSESSKGFLSGLWTYVKEQSMWERIYMLISILVICVCTSCNVNIQKFRQYCDKNGLYYVTKSSKIFDVGMSLLVIASIRLAIRYFGRGWMERNLKIKDENIPPHIRSSKMSKWIYDIFYYSLMQGFAYWAFRKQDWYPKLLGGEGGEFKDLVDNYPNFPKGPGSEYIETYYSIHFGNIIFTGIELITIRRTEDKKVFWEWMLHHILATFLVVFSYNYNLFICGLVTLIIHDISDIMVSLMKFYGDLKWNNSGPLFFSLVANMEITWFMTRIYLF